MALDANIRGSSSGNGAEVTATNELRVTGGSATLANAGYAVHAFENSDGTYTSGVPYRMSPRVTANKALNVGQETPLFDYTFNATAQNTSLWKHVFVTQTMTQSSGFLNVNANATGTTTTHCYLQTWAHFALRGGSGINVSFSAQTSLAVPANQVFETGLFLGVANAVPGDGVFIRWTSAGLYGVLLYNGTETATSVFSAFTPSVGVNYTFYIKCHENEVEFYVAPQGSEPHLLGEISTPAGNGQPFTTTALPFTISNRNAAAVTSATTFKVSDVFINAIDLNYNIPISQQQAMLGLMGSQGQDGGTLGTTAVFPNAAGATTVTGGSLSQTVALSTGLGGQVGITATVPGVDGMVTNFQVPTGGVAQTPRRLVITGMRVSSVNIGAAVAGTASTLSWSLAYGATGGSIPSLAQADTGSFVTATAKSWRRVPVGMQSWIIGAAVGQREVDIDVKFTSPIVVNPGEWVGACAKFIQGTTTASQVIFTNVMFDTHYI
jgi:hypothetical protein